MVGTLIDGKYEIRREIGSGGMGVVYEAYHRQLERLVALKMVTNHLQQRDAARFEREAMSTSRLSHRNVVRFLGYGVWDGLPYMVMELLSGQSLQHRLASHSPIPAAETLQIARQICSGLSHAHSHGVIHRDIKPSNILLCDQPAEPNACVKILDFGVAQLVGHEGQKLTQTGAVLGSVLYISPEQALGQPTDERSDIYGIGCVLFECSTGVPPFDGDNPMVVLMQHAHELATASPQWKNIPQNLQPVIRKCLAKNPDDRYLTVDALDDDLALVQSGGMPTLQANSGRRKKPAPGTIPSWLLGKQDHHQSKVKLYALSIFALVLIACAVIWLTQQSSSDATSRMRQVAEQMRVLVAKTDVAGSMSPEAHKQLIQLLEDSKKYPDFDPDLLFRAYLMHSFYVKTESTEKRHKLLKEISERCIGVGAANEGLYLDIVTQYQDVCTLLEPTNPGVYQSCVPTLEAVIAAHTYAPAQNELALLRFELAEHYAKAHRYKDAFPLYLQAIPYLEGNYLKVAKQHRDWSKPKI